MDTVFLAFVVAIAVTALLAGIYVVTSDVLTYRELQRKLRRERTHEGAP